MYPSGLTITPEPRLEARRLCDSNRSPKKRRNTGSSIRGWEDILISLLVKTFTTDGMAFCAATLKLPALGIPSGIGVGATASFIVTMVPPPAGDFHGSSSGLSVETTNSAARTTVVV